MIIGTELDIHLSFISSVTAVQSKEDIDYESN